MPSWRAINASCELRVKAEEMISRFDKETGVCTYQLINVMLVYENRVTGERRIIVAERAIISEDNRYVYLRLAGRMVEATERIRRNLRERSVRQMGREAARVATL